ncbi:biliverdin-producing heme oxygenase [Derxia gummosa]|uniref:Biliverdin-producing heme oxygenase n=1 Tax=Derxia gummosa DSM 723 TaxID=1121388 RepID=A0A8B6X9Y2_9BURK|nr:biliverdin-producing heme oxygenase [Derxia gummosa]
MEPDLLTRLRAETAEVHRRLDSALGLLTPPPDQCRVTAFLEGMHGFLLGWVPALSASLGDADGDHAQRRLALVASDLLRLGHDRASLAALPVCATAARCAATPATALGSLYVIEGSMLGGLVIARALADATWLPPGGLGYLARDAADAERWRLLARRLAAAPPAEAVIAGARECFECLADWLPHRLSRPVATDA